MAVLKVQAKIPSYQPGPTVVAVEPPPFVVPRMSVAPVAPPKPLVWRLQEPDLHAIVDWLIPALQAEHPRLSPEGVLTTLRHALIDRTSLLCRTAAVVGLFRAELSVLDPVHPEVREIWVRSQEAANDQAQLLYLYARDWAVSLHASRLTFNLDSDCAMSHVSPALMDVKKDFTVRKASIFAVRLTE